MTELVVAYSVDRSFLLPCGVSIKSLVLSLEASPVGHTTSLHIIVFHDNQLSSDEIESLRACATSTGRRVSLTARHFDYAMPSLLCEAPRWNNIETAATLIIPDLLRDHSRVLFLDADTLVVGDIVELWQTNLHGRPCACVPDHDQKSPNAGVILYDVAEWNRRDLTAKCLQYVSTHPTLHIDQEPFGMVEGADFAPLDIKWNYHGVDTWMYRHYGRNLPAHDVRIVHFNGSPRPWTRACPRRYADQWHDVLRQTPLRSTTLTGLTPRDFLAFRIPPLEMRTARAISRWRIWVVPYLILRRSRVWLHYARHRLEYFVELLGVRRREGA